MVIIFHVIIQFGWELVVLQEFLSFQESRIFFVFC